MLPFFSFTHDDPYFSPLTATANEFAQPIDLSEFQLQLQQKESFAGLVNEEVRYNKVDR